MDVKVLVLVIVTQQILAVPGLGPNSDCVYINQQFKTYQDDGFTLPIREPKIYTSTESKCKKECENDPSCIIWQWRKERNKPSPCYIMNIQPQVYQQNVFGIKNCKNGKPRGEYPVCQVHTGNRVNTMEPYPESTQEACKEKCDDDNDCIIWEFDSNQKKCFIFRLEIGRGRGKVGIHYCTPVTLGPDADCVYENQDFITVNDDGKTLPIKYTDWKTETGDKCKEECDKNPSCIIWQWQPTETYCWIMSIKPYAKQDNIFGIKSCEGGKPKEAYPVCEVRTGDRKNKMTTHTTSTQKACKDKCDDDNDCIIWEFDRSSNKKNCNIHQLIIRKKKLSHVGIHYCTPKRCGVENKPRSASKIIGGVHAYPNQYPWQVLVISKDPKTGDWEYCGGTLISSQSILTAAHCVYEIVKVKVGLHDIQDIQDFQGVEKVHIHEDYVPETYENDIAVLFLENDVLFDQKKTAPICLPLDEDYLRGKDHEEKQTVTVIGWGDTNKCNNDHSNPNTLLKAVELETMTNENCNKEINKARSIIESRMPFCDQICAIAANKEHAPSWGDSGGPMMLLKDDQFTQIGIVSNKLSIEKTDSNNVPYQCQLTDRPGVFVRITSHLNFIKKHRKGDTWPQSYPGES